MNLTPANAFPLVVVCLVIALVVAVAVKGVIAWISDRNNPHNGTP